MKTLQGELSKYRHFISDIRKLGMSQTTKENFMVGQTHQQESRNTGGMAANKRYKRSSEELEGDIRKVDELIASGQYNQIEALEKVGLQSSVYHYKKRQMRLNPAKSVKPRKFAPRPNRRKGSFDERKEQVLRNVAVQRMEQNNVKNTNEDKLLAELAELRQKYNKLKEYVVENIIIG